MLPNKIIQIILEKFILILELILILKLILQYLDFPLLYIKAKYYNVSIFQHCAALVCFYSNTAHQDASRQVDRCDAE